MNPSTDDIYEAIMATPAKNVLVLPNNKNIILAAEQTIPMVKDRNVIIVPTRTIPQGMTAMLNFDPEISAESNAQLMTDALLPQEAVNLAVKKSKRATLSPLKTAGLQSQKRAQLRLLSSLQRIWSAVTLHSLLLSTVRM